jgi:hypothetical protein
MPSAAHPLASNAETQGQFADADVDRSHFDCGGRQIALHPDFFAHIFGQNSLASAASQSDSCRDRGNNRQGETRMTTLTTEETGSAQATGAEKPKAGKKARVAPKRAHVAAKKATAARNAKPAKKVPKGVKKAESARDGSKAAKIIDLLKRPNGATLAEIMKATNWQAHSVRGFISGSLAKKMGLPVESAKREDGERVYSISR